MFRKAPPSPQPIFPIPHVDYLPAIQHYKRMYIKLENLYKTYKSPDGSDIHAVDGISLNIPENKIFGIIGKSGAGKSSLVRLISMLERPDSGAVFYNEERVDNLDEKSLIERRRKIGMIFQNFNLFSSRTAAKNVAYPLEINGLPKEEIDSRVKEMLALVGLEDKGDASVSQLSGGQKQRIAIARALATKPDILFCDEATSALDPQTTRSILQLISQIQKKMNLTVVMITHQMEVVRDACEQVAVIEDGKVVEQGSVEKIFTHPKSAAAKDFLRHIAPSEEGQIEKSIKSQKEEKALSSDKNIVRWSKSGGAYELRFTGKSTDQCIISDIIKKFKIDINIRAGGIQMLKNKKVGLLLVDMSGSKSAISKTLDYLKEAGVNVEAAK